MATHSSVLAWRIPWKEQPGGLGTVPGVAKSRTWLSGRSVHVLCPEDWPFRACITPADLSLQQPSEQGACGKLPDASPMPTLQGSSYLAHRKLKLGMVSHNSTLCVCVCFNVRECSKVSYLWNLLNFQWISIIVTFSLHRRAGDWERCRPTDWQTDRRPSWARAVGQAEIPSHIYRLYLISSPFANRCPCSKWKNFERSPGV